jgi:hypothetical protein
VDADLSSRLASWCAFLSGSFLVLENTQEALFAGTIQLPTGLTSKDPSQVSIVLHITILVLLFAVLLGSYY